MLPAVVPLPLPQAWLELQWWEEQLLLVALLQL